jgi:DnaK suppressor protein
MAFHDPIVAAATRFALGARPGWPGVAAPFAPGAATALARDTVSPVDPDHARQLLLRERERIEAAIADLLPQAADEQEEPGDEGDEDLYQKELDEGRAADLRDQLAALQRAEARLAEGTYGLSIESGEPIPDARLEALPTAERNIGE